MGKEDCNHIKIFDRTYDISDGCFTNSSRYYIGSGVPFSPQYVRTVTMCTHISSCCNLACKYCFKKNIGKIDFSDVCRFIDIVTQIYPNADRYIVDMSGDGEPLMNDELIFKTAEYCKKLSDKFVREFLPTLVTNGTLLTKETAERLQKAGVLFGVSLDGTKETHDKNRVYKNGKGTYSDIEKNITNIEHRNYVGAALTYTDGNLLRPFLDALRLLPTVSMKPVRSPSLDAQDVCNGYDELVKFLLEKTIGGQTEYISSLINGDDYFGKFLKRTALGINVYGRCDAGVGRFALAGDKNIYCCPAAVGSDEGRMGDLENGIRRSKIQKMWQAQRNDGCNGCFARGVCGGECKIVSYNKYGNFDGIDGSMCAIKRRLCLLARYFVDSVKERNKEVYDWLVSACRQAEAYYDRDEELIDAVCRSNGKYTFTQLKQIKDQNKKRFEEIYSELCSGTKIIDGG